ncbi:hypothetical protein [Paenibacillus donghaensis]|uniref:Uncharacterized protein n=1 Tax=Paenibacillus donghaensis TaxID=414771 RepID=A0A2Z2KK98_9BACL|nr:hypothetical protein [Paenibacillus donghaensis]ASA21402.1 hypothetical protein B9T62_11795 [Paenibacillus donghaensis]
MRTYRSTYTAVLLSTLILGQLAGQTALAAPAQAPKGASTAAVVPASLGSVQLGAGVKATLEDVNLWQQAGGNILTYTLNYSNTGSGNANLLHYFSRAATPGGSVIPGNPVTADAMKKKIGSKTTLRVTYYANLGSTTSLKGLKIPMYVWDAKAKGYLRHAGSFSIPSGYTSTVAGGRSLSKPVNDIPAVIGAESLELYKYSGKVFAKVGVSFTNRGNKVLSDPGYAAYLQSAGGSYFELALDSAQSGYKIQPQEKKIIYYLTEIPSYLKTENMKLQFTQTDPTLKLEMAKHSFMLPAAKIPNLVVGPDGVRKISINSNTLQFRLANANVFSEDSVAKWSLQLKVKNSGKKAVTLPTYELAVKTATGTTFPVNAKALNGIVVKPLEEKVVQLTAEVPLEVDQSSLQLQMIEAVSAAPDAVEVGGGAGGKAGGEASAPTTVPTSTATLRVPVAYFTMPLALKTEAQKGQVYSMTNQYGSFSYNLHSLQRLPWKDDDILVARLSLTNTQKDSLTLPALKGAIKLDNDDYTAGTELFVDKDTTTIAPGATVEIDVLAKVPYTEEYNNLKLSLYSVVKEENVPFLSFTTDSVMNAVETVKTGGSYSVVGKGKNAKVLENKTAVYEGVNSKVLYSEMLLTSEEKRQSKMARIQAYYRTSDGEFYEAVSNQPEMSAAPGGKQLITFWAKLPRSVSITDLQLYMGPGITGTKLTEVGQEPTGFINIAALQLNPQVNVADTNLLKVALYPYTLAVTRSEGRTQIGSDSINVTMNYNLTRDSSYDMGTFSHKLVLKMTDPFGQSQERSLNIGTELTEGTNNTYAASFTNHIYKSITGGTYKLTLYDEFQGERIELASQVYNMTIDRVIPPDDKQ